MRLSITFPNSDAPLDPARSHVPRAGRRNSDSDTFTISLRTGWDPQGMDPLQIADERAAFAEVGVQHVVAAPWRSDADAWLASMEQLADLAEPSRG